MSNYKVGEEIWCNIKFDGEVKAVIFGIADFEDNLGDRYAITIPTENDGILHDIVSEDDIRKIIEERD